MSEFTKFVQAGAERVRARLTQREHEADVGYRVLPPDLRESIKAGCVAERASLLARIEAIDTVIEQLNGQVAKARAEYRSAVTVKMSPGSRRVTWDGKTVVREGRPMGSVGPAAIKKRQALTALQKRVEGLQLLRAQLRSELGTVANIERQAATGVISPLMTIVARWRGMSGMGVLIARLVGSVIGGDTDQQTKGA